MRVETQVSDSDLSVTARFTPDLALAPRALFEAVIQRVADILADRFLERFGPEVLDSIDKEDVKALCRVQIAKKVYTEMAELESTAAPFTKGLPEMWERTRQEMRGALKGCKSC